MLSEGRVGEMFIYKIYSDKGDKVYIGSTIQSLTKRFSHHKSHSANGKGGRCTSYDLFDEYGAENCKIDLLEECEPEKRYERERFWIETTAHAVNKVRTPRQSHDERKQAMCAYMKRWIVENPEAYKERMKRNAIQQKQKQKERYVENYTHIRAQASEKVVCECGIVYSRSHRIRHQASVRHQDLMKNKSLE